jgi:hypothetical protein
MWYRTSKDNTSPPPQEVVKALDVFARNAIIKYLILRRQYSPEERLINSIKKRFFEKIEQDYGNLKNIILYTNGLSLKNLVDQNIYEIIGRLK